MKITNRFPSIEANQSAENEKPTQSDKSEKKDGLKTIGPHIGTSSKDILENLPAFPGPGQADEILGIVSDFVNEQRSSSSPKVSSRVEKFKGPDSIELPQIQSKVDRYKGPDSIQRATPESKVETYKGPDSLPGDPKIESRVDKYKGPDSLNRNNFPFPTDAFDNLPSFPGPDADGILGLVRRVFDGGNDSVDFKKSQVESEVSKYKGPDSIALQSDETSKDSERTSRRSRRSNEKSSTKDALLRMQIEDQLKK